ncbi:MAG: hydroxymethylglutaryl-CoA lyase [Flavobacteriales bacterium]|nr:hydroxymethylglutaryl-CoA lyase [Flavobacteriales bacterium]
MNSPIKIVECPRDAMQGIHEFIPTETKTEYINSLLKAGFDTIDFGSFVSPKAIPQLVDTANVLAALNLVESNSKLLAIVANKLGAEDACNFEEIDYLGFPFSISETFQQRNTNSSIEESLRRVEHIQSLCLQHNKTMVVYISMAFGNPYGDKWNPEVAIKWTTKLVKDLDIEVIALADTTGVSNPENISELFGSIIPEFPSIEIGAHLHTTPETWEEKVDAAVKSGCTRFDSAIKGFGGCPMAADDLTGNMPTENLLSYFDKNSQNTGINNEAFEDSMQIADRLFTSYH